MKIKFVLIKKHEPWQIVSARARIVSARLSSRDRLTGDHANYPKVAKILFNVALGRIPALTFSGFG